MYTYNYCSEWKFVQPVRVPYFFHNNLSHIILFYLQINHKCSMAPFKDNSLLINNQIGTMPLNFLVSLLRGLGVSMWSWFWIGHIYILIIYTNTTNNIYNMLIEIKDIWYYIYSVLSIMTWELFLVPKKKEANQPIFWSENHWF